MTVNIYDIGDEPTLSITFLTPDTTTGIDPTTVVCRVKAPDGTVTSKTYGSDVEVVRDATGVYHLLVLITQSGTYRYRWEGTGAAQGAEEGRFDVRRSGVLA